MGSKKKKKNDVKEDDVIRKFVTFHVNEVAKEKGVDPSNKEKAELVDTILTYQEENLTGIVRSTAEMFFDNAEDEEDEEDDSGEDSGEEDDD